MTVYFIFWKSLTGANVAASNNLTGSAAAEGDWNLEVTTGLIKSPLAFSKAVQEAYTAVLIAPVIIATATPLPYSENDPATAIDSGITITDADSTDLTDATVSITTGFVTAEDILSFDNSGTNITTSSYDSVTGVLTLTGNATVIDYETALKNVKYENSSDNPSTTQRTISFVVNDGTDDSTPITRNINLTAVNDAPVITTTSNSALEYTEDDAATAIDSGITITDVDSPNLTGATVSITTGFVTAEDILSFDNSGTNITTSSYDSVTGVLTLTGNATVIDYETALKNVKYENSSDNPTTTQRTISFVVNDGTDDSTPITRNINLTAVNDAPVITTTSNSALEYTEDDAATAIDSGITITDVDSPNLTGATVSITTGFVTAEDILSFDNSNSDIITLYETGVLTLTGNATVAEYEAALKNVKYENSSDNPTTTQRTISFVVNDGTDDSTPITRNINLTAVNDAPVITTTSNSALEYTEDDAATAIDSGITITDVDSPNLTGATVSITTGFVTAEDILSFDNSNSDIITLYETGVLTLTGNATVAEYEAALKNVKYENSSDNPTTTQRTISFVVNDGTDDSTPVTRDITFIQVNDAPTELTLSQLTVDENVTAATEIGAFTTTDPDAGDTFTYSLVAGTGDTDNAAFTVVGDKLQINASPDFEAKASYKIRVQTTDDGGLSFEKELTIAVNNLDEAGVNEAPTDLALSQLTVDENVTAATEIGAFTTTDPDAGDTFTYSLVAGTGDTDNTAFTVVGDKLQINASPDFEAKASYKIRVQTTDDGGLSFEKELTIAVNNLDEAGVNDAPTDLTLSQLTVDENVTAATEIGAFTTTDPDAGDTFTYSLVAGTGDTDNAAFTVVGDKLQINASPDFEAKASYKIRVQTTDDGGLSFEKELTIAVNNLDEAGVNEAPTDLALSQLTVDENVTAATEIGAFTTTDPDAGDTFTYSLVAGTGDTDNTAFTVVGDKLQINASPDFEAKASYKIRVQTTDDGGLSFEKELTIAVNNLDEAGVNDAPTDLTLSQLTVDENVSAATEIGAFSTTDPDAGDIFLYSLVAGTGDTDNGAFTVVGDKLQINASPDFEAKASYKIRVQTTDDGGLSFDKELTILVNDLNEAPTELTLSKLTVDENVTAGAEIGTFTSTDPDTGDIFLYSLVAGAGDTDNGAFTVEGDKLKIKASPDFEAKASYNIRVRTTDADGLLYDKELAIAVNDLNDAVVNDTTTFTKSANNDIFTIKGKGNDEKARLSIDVTAKRSSDIFYELGLFVVDNQEGKIGGIAPGDAGYTEAALNRAKVIGTSLANYPEGFSPDFNSVVELRSGEQIRFYLVRNGTTDSVLAGKTGEVVFSDPTDPTKAKIDSSPDGSFSLALDGQNFEAKIRPADEQLPLGASLQGQQEGELIDLRRVAQSVTAKFTVNREAAYDNYVGFYQVADQNGGIDTNKDGTADILVGQAGYTEAAIKGGIPGIDLSVGNQGTASFTGTFAPGSLFAPFIIVGGTPDAILDTNVNNNPEVYFTYLGANSDKADHIRQLATNTFGFEDLLNGGDNDYNDVIVKINLTVNPL